MKNVGVWVCLGFFGKKWKLLFGVHRRASWTSCWTNIDLPDIKVHIPGSKISKNVQKQPRIAKRIFSEISHKTCQVYKWRHLRVPGNSRKNMMFGKKWNMWKIKRYLGGLEKHHFQKRQDIWGIRGYPENREKHDIWKDGTFEKFGRTSVVI